MNSFEFDPLSSELTIGGEDVSADVKDFDVTIDDNLSRPIVDSDFIPDGTREYEFTIEFTTPEGESDE